MSQKNVVHNASNSIHLAEYSVNRITLDGVPFFTRWSINFLRYVLNYTFALNLQHHSVNVDDVMHFAYKYNTNSAERSSDRN